VQQISADATGECSLAEQLVDLLGIVPERI
jgi:hypothetical protein